VGIVGMNIVGFDLFLVVWRNVWLEVLGEASRD
jgi:hypothetical protein